MKADISTVLYVVLSAVAATLAGASLSAWLLPFLQAAVFFPVYFRQMQRKRWRRAFSLALLWAVTLSATVIILSWQDPQRTGETVLNGEEYKEEMFRWVATGEGPESDIRQFLPLHLLHLILFSTLSLISGGMLGLLMGSILLNYMSYYVGTLLSHSLTFLPVVALAWPPWAILRVIGFILIAISLSSLAYRRVGLESLGLRLEITIARAGLVLLVLDILLKWLIAPVWQLWLKQLTTL